MADESRFNVIPDGFGQPTEPRVANPRHLSMREPLRTYRTKADWLARAAHVREHVLVSCGLWPMPEKTPLKAKVFGKLRRDGYTIEKVCLHSLPNFFVTGNLYRPAGGARRRPAVLCPHGHWRAGRMHDDESGSIPGRCITFARQGYVAFAYDMIGYNDADQIGHPCPVGKARDLSGPRAQLWSISHMGVQLWNSIRSLDFLESLPDVDPDRIGCTGASGGGTQAFMLMAADDRLAAAAPVNMISAHFQGGCECENAPNLRIDTNNLEIAATFAPKPLLLISATGDWTHETPKVEYPAIRRIYSLFDARDRVAFRRVAAPHNYNRQSREAVYAWFGQWLLGKNDPRGFEETPFVADKPKDLRVFAPGKRPASALDADGLVETIVSRTKRRLAAAGDVRETFGVGLAHSLGLVCRGRKRVVADAVGRVPVEQLDVEKLLLQRPGDSHKVPALAVAQRGRRGPAPTILVLHDKGKAALFDSKSGQAGKLLSTLVQTGCRLLIADCFNTGELRITAEASRHYQSFKFFTTYNCTETALAVQDIVLALDYLAGRADAGSTTLLAVGHAGPRALLAAPFATRLDRAVIDLARFDPADESAWCKHLFAPGLLQAGGLHTAAAMFAPRPLLLHNAPAFDAKAVNAAYKAAGAPDAFRCSDRKAPPPDLLRWILPEGACNGY